MVAHAFPPAGGSGANRALAFARYLPMYGWRPIVLTVDSAWAAHRDDALLRLVPPAAHVVRTASLEPRPRSDVAASSELARHAERARTGRRPVPRWLKRHLGHLMRFPDAHLGWLPFAVTAGWRQEVDLMYSSSGPFTSHLVGLVLSKLLKKPWVAELRDGWYLWNRSIFADYPGWRGPIERRLEAAVVRSADRVVLVTERMAAAFRAQYADLPAEHFAVVSNGFDPRQIGAGDIGELAPLEIGRVWGAPVASRARAAEGSMLESEAADTDASGSNAVSGPGSFEVVHAGALYYGRSISTLLDAAERLRHADPRFAQAFRLTLIGSLDATARAELARHALARHVRVEGQLPHATVMRRLRGASVLLLVANTTPLAEATVPGKLFEYLAVGRPVLALAPRASSTADVLEQTGGGWLAPGDDLEAVTAALRQAFQNWQDGGALRPDRHQVARYSRARLAGELARVFEQALGAERGGAGGGCSARSSGTLTPARVLVEDVRAGVGERDAGELGVQTRR